MSNKKKVKDIFISHSSRDIAFIQALREYLKEGLRLSDEQIFCSSIEETQMKAGENINKALRKAIRKYKVFIAVISPSSLQSTYVLFELGARWGQNKHMFPVLVPEMESEELNGPLRQLHAYAAKEVSYVKLIEEIGKVLDIKPQSYASMIKPLEKLLSTKPDFVPMAYAVLSYVIDKNNNFALLKDPYYKKIQPPGRRISPNEQPHKVALKIASVELGLPIEDVERFPLFEKVWYSDTAIVAPPYQVQFEKSLHRKAFAHYDFVYVFTVGRVKPKLVMEGSPEHKAAPQWYSFKQVKARLGKEEWGPHEDMIPTMERILEDAKLLPRRTA